MKTTITALLFLSLPCLAMSQPPLAPHQWENRIILLYAEASDAEALENQLKRFEAEAEGMEERKLVVYQVFADSGLAPDGVRLERDMADDLRRRYKLGEEPFQLLLIGLDGGVKLRAEAPVSTDRLFALIDSMPMRRAEMRRKGNNGH